MSYDAWLRAHPLPRIQEDQKKKESNSSSCNKSLFNISSWQSRCETKGKGKEGDEGEVEQRNDYLQESLRVDEPQPKAPSMGENILKIAVMAESIGAVDISNVGRETEVTSNAANDKKKKWTTRQATRKVNPNKTKKLDIEYGKRNLVDVMIINGTVEGCGSGEKKVKGQEVPKVCHETELEVVLEIQHRINQ
ncbi:unnamed protein product [Lathyrus sativus]|nr:unnamed protein product [Lathyrus sativus]